MYTVKTSYICKPDGQTPFTAGINDSEFSELEIAQRFLQTNIQKARDEGYVRAKVTENSFELWKPAGDGEVEIHARIVRS